MTNAREKLVKELNKFCFDDTIDCCVDLYEVVNFILADRKRIVGPLYKIHQGEFTFKELNKASIETLKLAGVING